MEKMKKKIQIGESYSDLQLFMLAIGGIPNEKQVITEEFEYTAKIAEQIIAIASPEELLKVAEEAMKIGRYSLIAEPAGV